MNKHIKLKEVSIDYEIGPAVTSAQDYDGIEPIPSPDCFTIEELQKFKRVEYNKGITDLDTQSLADFENKLEGLGISFCSNELLLDVIEEMKRKGLIL